MCTGFSKGVSQGEGWRGLGSQGSQLHPSHAQKQGRDEHGDVQPWKPHSLLLTKEMWNSGRCGLMEGMPLRP